ncbi:MAG: hypothetical protein AAAFM81_00855 [Pseudomonadota bacterium]
MNTVIEAPRLADAPLDERATCRFNLLDPYADGVGEYHINTHVVYFRPPGNTSPQAMTRALFNMFPTVFNPNNVAVVQQSTCRFQNKGTLKFTGKVPALPDLHDDWVATEWRGSNFRAQTLERRWLERWEVAALAARVPLPGFPGLPVGLALPINRRHFLAGVRSWHVGQMPSRGLYFLETAAFERYSHRAFIAAAPMINIRAQILETWTKLLENFLLSINATAVNFTPPGYQINRAIRYQRASAQNPSQLRATPWFAGLLSRHSGL